MKNLTFILVILIIVVSASCKKESTKASRKLRTYSEDVTARGLGHIVETFDVNYDDKDRITSVVSVTKPGHRLVYQYTNEDVFTFERFEDDKVTLHRIYFINSSLSLVDSTFQYNNQQDTISFKYFYDGEKRLVKQKEYIHSYHIPNPVAINVINYQYDMNGVLTKRTDLNYETSYRYDAEQINTVQIEPFYVPVQKYLPSHTYIMRWGATTTIEHTYTFDDHKRLTSERAASSDGKITVKSYTYQ